MMEKTLLKDRSQGTREAEAGGSRETAASLVYVASSMTARITQKYFL